MRRFSKSGVKGDIGIKTEEAHQVEESRKNKTHRPKLILSLTIGFPDFCLS